LATKAVELDASLPWSHIALAGALLANGRHSDAVDAVQRALALQPNGYEANLFTGFYLNFAGRSAQAVTNLEAANELSRIDTLRGLDFLGMAYFTDGQYAKSENAWLKRFQVFGVPKYPHAHVFLSGAQAAQDRLIEAASTVERFQRLMPNFKMSQWRWINNYKNAEDRKRLYDAAIKAGVPE
jgi:tetratricopeptide (TPR) repeat protein